MSTLIKLIPAIVLTLFCLAYSSSTNNNHLQLQSLKKFKNTHNHKIKTLASKHSLPMQKARSSFSVEFQNAKPNAEGILKIQAGIKNTLGVQNAKFKWILPEKVELTSGSLEGDLEFINGFVDLEVELSVLDQEDRIVRLEVYTYELGGKIGKIKTFYTQKHEERMYEKLSKRTQLEFLNAEGQGQKILQ